MKVSQSLSQLPLLSLVYHCRQENERFFRREQYDPGYGFELFRRTFSQPSSPESEEAMPFLIAQYKPQVERWAHKHWRFRLTGENAGTFADQAFTKMWFAFAKEPNKFQKFSSLAGCLQFLRRCLLTVVSDFPLSEEDIPESLEVWNLPGGMELGNFIEHVLHCFQREIKLKEGAETTFVLERYVFGLKPREIQALYPDLFPQTADVHKMTAAIKRRLYYNKSDDRLRECLQILHKWQG